jgi:hypothetical protein
LSHTLRCFDTNDFKRILIYDPTAAVANVKSGRPMSIRLNFIAIFVTCEKAIAIRAIFANADPRLSVAFFMGDILPFHKLNIATNLKVRELASFTGMWSDFLEKN